MNVFVIHSTKDAEQVAEKVSYIKRNIYSFNALILKNGNCFWKAEAASKIRTEIDSMPAELDEISYAMEDEE